MTYQPEESRENTPHQPHRYSIGLLVEGVAVFIGISMYLATFLPPERPYALTQQFWYLDFRYWSPSIAYSCWIVFAWVLFMTLFTACFPKEAMERFFLRRSFYRILLLALCAISLFPVVYKHVNVSPISSAFNYMNVQCFIPLADYHAAVITVALLTVIVMVVLLVWRIKFYIGRWRQSKTTHLLLFFAAMPLLLGADDAASPQRVATSAGIFDVKSKDDLRRFSAEDIRQLVTMEDRRIGGNGMTPHPVLVYCFDEESIHYTGGKYNNTEIKYRLHVPNRIVSWKKYPLVVHLHGVGESGNDNTLSLAHLHSILPLMVGTGQQDFFLLVTQCPKDDRSWRFKAEKDGNLDVVMAVLDNVMKHHPVDANRISTFGISSGGSGVWDLVQQYPDKFAAAVPTSCSPLSQYKKLASLTQTPIWTFKNKLDNVVPLPSIMDAMRVINGSGGYMKLTQFDQGGHAAWRPAMDECNCFGWMIAQKRGGLFNPPPERKTFTHRSFFNCFFAFFLPLILSVGLLYFQRMPYFEKLHEQIAAELYPFLLANFGAGAVLTNKETEIAVSTEEGEYRLWTNSNGKKRIELKLLGFRDGKALFMFLNGAKYLIPFDFFCSAERKTLKEKADKQQSVT